MVDPVEQARRATEGVHKKLLDVAEVALGYCFESDVIRYLGIVEDLFRVLENLDDQVTGHPVVLVDKYNLGMLQICIPVRKILKKLMDSIWNPRHDVFVDDLDVDAAYVVAEELRSFVGLFARAKLFCIRLSLSGKTLKSLC